MRRTRSAASAAGIPAAVTDSGRTEEPRRTGVAWVAVQNRDLANPDHRDAGLCVCMRAQAGPAGVVRIGIAIGHQQAQLAQAVRDCAQRRELAQVELARPAGRYPGYHRGAFGQHVRETASAASTAAARAPPVRRYCTSTAAHTPQSGRPPVSMS
jgi:hypothetical protein